jgi:hypothetical protein
MMMMVVMVVVVIKGHECERRFIWGRGINGRRRGNYRKLGGVTRIKYTIYIWYIYLYIYIKTQ